MFPDLRAPGATRTTAGLRGYFAPAVEGRRWVTRGRQLYLAGGLRTWSGRLLYVPGFTALVLFAANALLLGSVAVFALALCFQLSVAVISFHLVAAASS